MYIRNQQYENTTPLAGDLRCDAKMEDIVSPRQNFISSYMPRILKKVWRNGKMAALAGLASVAVYGANPTNAEGNPRIPPIPGDMNCDGIVDMSDVPLFIDALLGQYTPQPPCYADGDMDGFDGVNGNDIQLFVDALLTS